jgi:hypothetical protein
LLIRFAIHTSCWPNESQQNPGMAIAQRKRSLRKAVDYKAATRDPASHTSRYYASSASTGQAERLWKKWEQYCAEIEVSLMELLDEGPFYLNWMKQFVHWSVNNERPSAISTVLVAVRTWRMAIHIKHQKLISEALALR